MGWKVVRDNDEAVCRAMGISGQWRPSADPVAGLARKLIEEAAEFGENWDAGELYDLLDVVQELLNRRDPNGAALNAHCDKVARRGKFTKAIEWCPVPAGEGGPG